MEVQIQMPNTILQAVHYVAKKTSKDFYRNGVLLEKGVVLTKKRIDKNIDFYKKLMNKWSVYPDYYIKEITPVNSKFKLKFFQKLFLRICLRHGRILTIAPRAAGKSFICILAMYLICIFRPHSHVFMCSPGKEQSAKIAQAKVKQLWDLLPLLKEEVIGDGNMGTGYMTLTFRNGSVFDVLTPLSSTRGNRATAGIIDEFRDHKADDISEIILPLLNVDRPMENQDKNPYEPQQVQMWISSASEKNTFAYDKTIEILSQSIINPKMNFIFGFDYQIPVKTGLLSKDFLNEMKLASTFSESGFAKEYMSRFVGTSNDAWFDYEKLLKYRRLVNPETKNQIANGSNAYYIISVDLARLNCQSVATILKVFPGVEKYHCNLVNIYILGKTENEKVFDVQVLELKRLIHRFEPREVVIDINGIGVNFADLMIRPTVDPATGITYPAYGFNNRDEYFRIQPKNAAKILYGIKANVNLNSDMHSSLYTLVYSGNLNFLISEKEAKNKLMATKLGQRMKIEQRAARLLPHELTSLLLNEIMNLKLKPTGIESKIAVDQINKRMTKDKFSALEMGTYRVQLIENEAAAHRRNRGLGRKLTFYRAAGGGI